MPTDDYLPRFHIRPTADQDPYKSTILHSQNYKPAEPAYLKQRSRHPDEYSVELLDAYIPDITFAQVLAKPTISTPSLSQDEIRRQNNGGSPVLPTITLPTEFTVQLYNPESQVIVRQKTSKWTGSFWEFSLPKNSFRQPTGSRLDAQVAKSSAAPVSSVSTFRWRKDGGVVSKTSLRCTMLSTASVSSHDPSARRKGGGEPDITVAIMDKLKDVTIYEPNLHRVDVEDKKGLELVLLLTATVIADIYFTAPSTTFNVLPQSSVSTLPTPGIKITPSPVGLQPPKNTSPIQKRPSQQTLIKTPTPPNNAQTIVNPNILAETSRLQRLQTEEDRKRQKETEIEQKRIRKMLEIEEKERKKKDAKIAAETERLRKQYGQDSLAWDAIKRDQQQRRPSVQNLNGGFTGGHVQRPSVHHPPSSYQRPQPPPQPPRPVSQQLPPRQPLYPLPERQQAQTPQPFLSPYSVSGGLRPEQPKRKASGFLKVFSSGGGVNDHGRLAKKKSSFW